MTTPLPRILVVDDNQAIRENVVEALHLEGYDAVEARDGATALRLLGEGRFDAILLDLVMPGMDGRELLARIREHPRSARLPVVVTTGHSDARARAGTLADAFLQKPFGVGELVAALRSLGVEGVVHAAVS